MSDLARLRQGNFLVIGRAGVDLYADPPGTKTEHADRFVCHLGGSSANIAVALVKLGHAASLVTCVSDDAVGRRALNGLDEYGVDRRFVRTVEDRDARNSIGLIETTWDDHQTVIFRNGVADAQMNEGDVADLPYEDFGTIVGTGTLLAGQPSRDATFMAFEKARAAGLPVVFDIDYRPYSWPSMDEAAATYAKAGRMADIVIGNDDEFGVMAGDYEKGRDFAASLVEEGVGIAVYKMGERGSVTFTKDGSFETPIFPVQALKPTGAGDSFMGAFLASLAAGHGVREAVRRGSAAAALVVTRVGCAPAMPDTAELEAFMEGHDQAAAIT